MKKIIVSLLVLCSIYSFGQNDSIQLTTLPIKNTLSSPSNAYLPYFEIIGSDTIMYRMQGSYFSPFGLSGTTISARSNSHSLMIGNSYPISGYIFGVSGKSTFFGDLYHNSYKSYYGSNYIQGIGNDIIFYDVTNGSKKLSDLIGGSTGTDYTANNGLTLSGTNSIGLGGSLSNNTDINIGAYNFNIYGSDSYLAVNPSQINATADNLVMEGTNTWEINNRYASIYYNNSLFQIKDGRTNPTGIQYFAHYPNSTCLTCIPDNQGVTELIENAFVYTWDTANFGSGSGETATYNPSALSGEDTLLGKVYNKALTYYKYMDIVKDTLGVSGLDLSMIPDNSILIAKNDTLYWDNNFTMTGSVRTSGAFYTGTTDPLNTSFRINYDGDFGASNVKISKGLSFTGNLASGVTLDVNHNVVTSPSIRVTQGNAAQSGVLQGCIGSTSAIFMNLNPAATDGATSIGYLFDTYRTLSTTGAKLFKINNGGTEKFSVDKSGFIFTAIGSNVASATTITPSAAKFHVTGTTTIQTINLPYTGFTGRITIYFDGVAPLGTSGNIKTALTPTINTGYDFDFDGTSWYIIQ